MFYTYEQLENFGFKTFGKNVLISDKCSIYGADKIEIGSDIRIDDFCVLSAGDGGIKIGNNVHIAIYSSLQGKGRITLDDFVGISSRVSIYSSNDDYFGRYMTNPTIPSQFTGVIYGDVTICKHVIVGCGSVILPNVILNMGCAVGSLSLVNTDCDELYIYGGNPLKKLFKRYDNFLKLEKEFLKLKNI